MVTGPPAGGKSTWVRAHAKPGDIIVDYDLLAAALTAPGADPHNDTRPVKYVTYRARSAAITEALKHVSTVDVYVVHSLPPARVMAKYAEHNARVVTVDPGRDVVMRRISERRPTSMVAVAERWYTHVGHATQTEKRSSRQW